MKNRRFYRLEQLSNLGIPSQTFIRAALQELHKHIPSLSNTFCWQDNEGNIDNIYDEHIDVEVINNFICAMTNAAPDDFTHTVEHITNLEKPSLMSRFIDNCSPAQKFHKQVLIPMGYDKSCFVPIKMTTNNSRLGLLILHKSKDESDFTEHEIHCLEYISTLIARGLSESSPEQINTLDDHWKQGLFIVNNDGKLLQACSTAQSLARMAELATFNVKTLSTDINLHLVDGFYDKVQQLQASKENNNIENELSLLNVSNAWGEFSLHGFMIMDKCDGERNAIGFYIRWKEPFVLKLFHRIPALKLTPRQETVALLYAIGDHHQIMANKLDLSLYTIQEHIKNISEQLKIGSRSELLEIILCKPN